MLVNDYTVIGGGISGLVMAALLAKAGKTVELCEKNNFLGGYFHNITQSQVPYGAHHLGIPSFGLFKEVFDILEISLKDRMVEANEITVMLGEEPYRLSLQLPELEKKLMEYFPHEKQNICCFIQYVKDFSQVLVGQEDKAIKKFFTETALISFEKLLGKYFQDEKLKRLLILLGPGYAGVDQSDSAFTFISLMATYGKGSYYLDSYGAFLVDALEKIICKENPGGIKTHCNIVRIEKREDIFTLFTQNNEKIFTRNIILACYPMDLLDTISRDLNTGNNLWYKIKRLTVGPSAYRFYFKVNKALENNEYVYIPYPDSSSGKDCLEESFFVMSTNVNEPGKINAMLTYISQEEIARETMERIISEARQYIAKLLGVCINDVKYDVCVTLKNRESSTSNKNGAVFGWKRNSANNLSTNLIDNIDSYIPHLFVVGHWSSTFGIFGSIFTVRKCYYKIMSRELCSAALKEAAATQE